MRYATGGFGGKRTLRLVPRGEREQLLFIAAAGLAFSVVVIAISVLNYRSDASARDGGNVSSNGAVSSFASVPLFVPERAVRAGEKLSEVPLKVVQWPASQVPDGAVRDKAELVALYARADIVAGMPLHREVLTKEPSRAPLPIVAGFRAVTIEVDQTTGLEGLALPGTRVDVLHTAREGGGEGRQATGQYATKAIVQNARVLSAGGSTSTVEERSSSFQGSSIAGGQNQTTTVTIEVTPEDAMRIANARHSGRLSLMMRAPEDTKILPDIAYDATTPSGGALAKYRDTKQECTRGRAKIDGREYVLHCDGTRSELRGFGEP